MLCEFHSVDEDGMYEYVCNQDPDFPGESQVKISRDSLAPSVTFIEYFSSISQVLFNGSLSFQIMVLNISYLMAIQSHWKLVQSTFGQIHQHQQAPGSSDHINRQKIPRTKSLGPWNPEKAEIVHQ